ncbi:MAG TPA: type I-C CRISPR-associated protein Cas5c [Spirochaetales bacterium]|nr:type I-C CRISPR-associated protein Cas5c [Spirochaetales bacterium]HRY53177.1 type I-C CRISPR-associated protein Cas5c [Spirochaetia bacterium]HRZ63282.1 type I-C CRISPR-associated protein Cas5c [Spirochaetia bacterium]
MRDWCLEVWGDYACFTRPEMKVERVSYDVITPSAARAIFEAILWKPAIAWHVTKIEVLEPIRWISVRRNEVGRIETGPTQAQMEGTSGEPMGLYIEESRQQRAGLFLRDVRYRIHARFEFIPPERRKANRSTSPEYWADTDEEEMASRSDEKEAKYAAMFERRAKKGQCFHRPYLGCREFACDFRLIDNAGQDKPAIAKSEELGWMLYDMDFSTPDDPKPLFFRARIDEGVINTDRRFVEVRG